MSQFDRELRSQFYLTGPRPCPYLPNRRERKLFTNLTGPDAEQVHDELAGHGFRRSQTIAYRPACPGCDACVSTRVRVAEFAPSPSQKRVLRRNGALIRAARPAEATAEQYALFTRYLARRHADGGMADMTAADFTAMIEDTPIRSHVLEYRLPAGPGATEPGALVAACLTDVLRDGVSLVYSFFDPDHDRRSLGQYVILDHVALAREAGLPFVYLGYWVPGSAKMDYKSKFSPAEILTRHGWRDLPPE